MAAASGSTSTDHYCNGNKRLNRIQIYITMGTVFSWWRPFAMADRNQCLCTHLKCWCRNTLNSRFTTTTALLSFAVINASCLIQKDEVQTYFTKATREVPYTSVSCSLPLTPRHPLSSQPYYTWNVSISNDNETFSNEKQLFVYDSKCLECNTADSCEQKVNRWNLLILPCTI